MQEGPEPLDCLMTQEEILEDLVKVAQTQLEEKLEEINFGVELGSQQPVLISNQLPAQEKEQLVALLKKYVDVFTCIYDEMLGLDPRLVVHSLNVDPGVKPVVQPVKVFHTDIEAQIIQEVKKLLAVGLSSPSSILNGFPT